MKLELSVLLKKVRKLDIQVKKSMHATTGIHSSLFKGEGLDFSDIREYIPTDDARRMDWKKSAQYNRPFIKLYEQSHEIQNICIFDRSISMNFGFIDKTKKDIAQEVLGHLLFSSFQNHDPFGVFFMDQTSIFHGAKKTQSHFYALLLESFYKSENEVFILKHIISQLSKKSNIFYISDHLPLNQKEDLFMLMQRHHFFYIEHRDRFEESPEEYLTLGEYSLEDGDALIDHQMIMDHHNNFKKQKEEEQKLLQKMNIPHLLLYNDDRDIFFSLESFFHYR